MGAAQNQGTVIDLGLQHPYLRNCKTRTTATDTELLATIPTQSTTYKRWKDELQSLNASLTTSHWLLLPKGHLFDEGGVCSTSGQLQLVYDYFPRLLSSQMVLRKKESRRFTQGQLWFLLYVLVMSKDSLAVNGEIIGDVHPRNVFLNNSGDIRVACLRSWPGQVSNYRRAVLEQDCGYLAPEDFQRLRLGALDNQINSQAEIFSIGLTLMTTSTLQLQNELYNMKTRQFDEQIFYSRLGKFQHDSLYSEIFRAVISNLLDVDPAKRMSLPQLKFFLQKHTENIIAKKPLRIDNVGKKLQTTINIMLKQIRQTKAVMQQPLIQSNIVPNVNQVRPGVRNSAQKMYINFEEKRVIPDIKPLLPKSQTSLQVNDQRSSTINIPPNTNNAIVKPPMPVSYLVTMINNEQPHRPIINKTFSSTSVAPTMTKTQSFTKIESPPNYKPFETITSKGQLQKTSSLKQQEPKILKQQPSLESAKVAQQAKQTAQKPNATEIWLGGQTQIGQLNLLMDTKLQGFGHHGLINPKYEPESVEQPPLQSFHASHQSRNPHQQQIFEQVKQQSEQQNNESSISQSPSTPICHLQKGKSSHQEQLLLDNSAKASPLRKSQAKQNEALTQSNKIEVIQLQTNNQTKPFSPLVKVWGMNLGFNKNKEKNASQTLNNIRKIQLNTQKPIIQSQEQKSEKHETQKLRQQRCLLQSNEVKRESQTGNTQELKQLNQMNKQQSKNDSKLLAIQSKKIINDEPQNNYILIEDQSKYTINQSRSSQVINENSHQQQIEQKKSQIFEYHTYADIVTSGTFEECWQQILVFLRDLTDYSRLIDANKVKIRITDDRWSLKVGPGVFDILLNKQQGKFLLKNCQGSLCQGEMLGGVFKDEQKKHRIWFNSAYYYNGAKIPSRQIIQQCLNKCQQNIASNSKK